MPQQPTHRFRKQVMKSLSTNENSRIVPTENMDRILAVRVDRGRTEVVSQRTITPAVVGFTSIYPVSGSMLETEDFSNRARHRCGMLCRTDSMKNSLRGELNGGWWSDSQICRSLKMVEKQTGRGKKNRVG
jgi:hypothetical protein